MVAASKRGRFADVAAARFRAKEIPDVKEIVEEVDEVIEEVGPVQEEEIDHFAELEAAERKRALARAKKKLSSALHEGHLQEALEAVELLLDEEEPIAVEPLRSLLNLSAAQPDAENFARAVSAAQRGKITFDEQAFAALIGQLLATEAAHALVRCALNFGVPEDGDVIPLIPLDIREYEQQDVFRAATSADDSGELDMDLAEGPSVPAMLEFSGCTRKPELNGLYQRHRGRKDLLGHSRPIYVRRLGFARKWCVYFWNPALTVDKEASSWERGWYLASEIGGGGYTVARCGSDEDLPPEQGWSFSSHGNWIPDTSGFLVPSSRAKRMQALNLTEEEAQNALEGVDLEALRGSVKGRDPEVTKYFCHFFVLLCLEAMAEIQGFRSRWRYRQLYELVNFGIAFQDLRVQHCGHERENHKAALPGWPQLNTLEVHFRIPDRVKEENCRFKPGENVVISLNDPVKNRVTEGMVKEVDFVGHVLVVDIQGQMPEDPHRMMRYRIDNYANRVTFERQVTALLQFIAMERTEICQMLVSAGVGKLDEAVREEAAIMRRRAWRQKQG
ncbi:Hypothetical protein SCF082_LOCUS3083 [Durusdinium trenchii]